MLTFDRLRELLFYDGETGTFLWRNTRSGVPDISVPAGGINKRGYVLIRVYGERYRAHRLAWLYCYGRWPIDVIDHRDGNPANNRIENLREASQSQNQGNRRRPSSNTSGYKGVYWHAHAQKWAAQIRNSGHKRHLGFFVDPADAHNAYLQAAADIFGEFARSA